MIPCLFLFVRYIVVDIVKVATKIQDSLGAILMAIHWYDSSILQ